jgi:hypothetical protein
MTNLLILIIATLSFWHFAYEGMIAPSLRMQLRFDFFKLRDRLRNLKIEHTTDLNDNVYSCIDFSINQSLIHMQLVNLVNVFSIYYHYKHDEEMKHLTDKKITIIQNCSMHEIKEIDATIIKLNAKSFLINSGAWAIYILPIVLLFFVLVISNLLGTSIKSFIERSIRRIAYFPKNEVLSSRYSSNFNEVAC